MSCHVVRLVATVLVPGASTLHMSLLVRNELQGGSYEKIKRGDGYMPGPVHTLYSKTTHNVYSETTHNLYSETIKPCMRVLLCVYALDAMCCV